MGESKMPQAKKLIDIQELKHKAKEVEVAGSFKSEDCDRHIQLAIAEQLEALVKQNTRIADALEKMVEATDGMNVTVANFETYMRQQ